MSSNESPSAECEGRPWEGERTTASSPPAAPLPGPAPSPTEQSAAARPPFSWNGGEPLKGKEGTTPQPPPPPLPPIGQPQRARAARPPPHAAGLWPPLRSLTPPQPGSHLPAEARRHNMAAISRPGATPTAQRRLRPPRHQPPPQGGGRRRGRAAEGAELRSHGRSVGLGPCPLQLLRRTSLRGASTKQKIACQELLPVVRLLGTREDTAAQDSRSKLWKPSWQRNVSVSLLTGPAALTNTFSASSSTTYFFGFTSVLFLIFVCILFPNICFPPGSSSTGL